jgi:two-component system OmpR family response regulator
VKPDDTERRSRELPAAAGAAEAAPCKAAPAEAAIPILVGTRDAAFADALRAALPGGSWIVAAAATPRAFRAALRTGPAPSFAAIDADAFGAEAAELCRQIRRAEAEAGTEPAVVEAWTRDMSPEVVREALAAGADDCRAPVSPDALALLLAARAAGDAAAAAGSDEVRIDEEEGRATLGGRDLPLTASCFAALCVLASHGGAPVSRRALLREMRGAEAGSVQPRSVDSLMFELRARLGPAGWRVGTAWGLGYRWIDGPRPSPRPGRRRRLPVRRIGAGLALVLLAALGFAAFRHAGGVVREAEHSAFGIQHSALNEPAPPAREVDPVVRRLRARFREEAAGTEGVGVAAPPTFGPLEPPVPHWLGGQPAAAAPAGGRSRTRTEENAKTATPGANASACAPRRAPRGSDGGTHSRPLAQADL